MAEDTTLKTQFFQDSLDILSDAEEIVLQLEQQGSDQEQVHSLFRLFHTLKGNSNMVGEEEINSLTHALESKYDQVRNGKRELDAELLQSTFEVIDLLNAVCQEGDSGAFKAHINQLSRQLNAESKAISPDSPVREQPATRNDSIGSGLSSPSPEQVLSLEGDISGTNAVDGLEVQDRPAKVAFSEWKPVLRSFYTCEKVSEELRAAGENLPDLLMDLGMEAIELRSRAEDPDQPRFNVLTKTAVYLEKFTATLAREQIEYNDISYELLYVLLDDFKQSMWQQLYLSHAVAYKKIATMEEMNRVEQEIGSEDKMWVIDLAFASSNPARSSDFFSRMVQIKRNISVPLVYISPYSQYYRKAADLLDQALGGFDRIAGTIEDGVKMHILTEE